MTLSGFDNRKKTPDDWRAYKARLDEERRTVIAEFRTLQNPSLIQKGKALSRYDLLSEFLCRAQWEIDRAEDNGRTRY